MSVVYLSRIESFSSSHLLNSSKLSIEENLKVFGKCNHSHGHNYELEVVVRGKINPLTGMVINISDLKPIIKANVLDLLDHKNLDEDVEYFKAIPSTTENLAVFIWNQLKIHLNNILYKVIIRETKNNTVEYMGEVID